MNTWEEIGLGQVPSEIVKAGLGLAPLTDGRHWYCKQGNRVLRAGLARARTGLGDVNNDLANAAQAIADNPPGQGVVSIVSDFQRLYNANGGSPNIAVDGEYGPCTRDAVQAVLTAAGPGFAGSAPPSAYPGTCSNGQYVAPSGGGSSSGGGTITPSTPSTPATTSSGVNTTGMLLWGGLGAAGGGLLGYFVSHAFRGPRMHIRAYTAVGALAGAGVGGYFGSKS